MSVIKLPFPEELNKPVEIRDPIGFTHDHVLMFMSNFINAVVSKEEESFSKQRKEHCDAILNFLKTLTPSLTLFDGVIIAGHLFLDSLNGLHKVWIKEQPSIIIPEKDTLH